jgi:very-short-patch-repair endonuclease
MGPSSRQRSPWTLARRQHGVISHAQLIALGYGADAIKHRVGRGRLHRIHRGVYAVGRRELTQEGRWMAAVLACGETAALSHDSAAALWGIAKPATTPIHVSVLGAGRSRNGIAAHRRTALATTTHERIPVTTPAQTLIDLAQTWPRSDLEQAIGAADLRRRIGLRALRTAATKAGKSGAALRAVIQRATFRVTQSELEREFLRLLANADLPLPATQERFGEYRVDFYWPELRLVAEADGGNFHRTATQQTNDRRREHAHLRAGRAPMRVTHWQVCHEPDETTALLADVVARLRQTANANAA